MTTKFKRLRRYYHYSYCHRCYKKTTKLHENNLLDDNITNGGLVYYCDECAKVWNKIYTNLNNYELKIVKKILREFMSNGQPE